MASLHVFSNGGGFVLFNSLRKMAGSFGIRCIYFELRFVTNLIIDHAS